MPGLLITTSQAAGRSRPPRIGGQTSRPSESLARGAGVSSTRTGSMPMDCRRRRLAVPSTPSPQMPTDALVSADQEIRGRIAIRNVVGSDGRQRSRSPPEQIAARSWRRWPSDNDSSSGEPCAIGTGCRRTERGPALAHVAHALEGLVVGVEPQQRRRSGSPGRDFPEVRARRRSRCSSAAVMNGARMRSMKQHLSQVPHQWPRRVGRS